MTTGRLNGGLSESGVERAPASLTGECSELGELSP